MTTPLTVTNVIDGKAVNGSSAEIRQIFNPSTGEVLTQLNESTVEDGDRAVAAARAAFPAWAARDRKSTRLNSSHYGLSRMPSSA